MSDEDMKLMKQHGTCHAAELLKQEKDLGGLIAGRFADVIAVPGNPLDDIRVMRHVSFVMKAGVVYKREGRAVDLDLEPHKSDPR